MFFLLCACLLSGSVFQVRARAAELRNELNHRFRQLQGLMGERLALLERDPVDAAVWHRGVTELLTEKIELLERLKLGPFQSGSSSGHGVD